MTLQNVVDQTQVLHVLKAEGIRIDAVDLAFLSPYATSHPETLRRLPHDTNRTPATCQGLADLNLPPLWHLFARNSPTGEVLTNNAKGWERYYVHA